jgi:branched-chain amino acid aminotransferase
METIEKISIQKTKHSGIQQVDWNNLEFGKYNSDHMLACDYGNREWQSPKIIPFTNLSLSPTTLGLHYGQCIFEGLKAFRMVDDRINIFRPDRHYERFVKSAERMCMAVIPEWIFMDGLRQLIELDKDWVPRNPGGALYIRPFMIATEARLGVKVSEEFRFMIISGPVGPYYQKPVSVKIETEFVRAAKGGTGYAKCAGNYGAAFYPTQKAKEQGYEQVLWTDGKENKYIEESGTMNVMFVINGILVTPPLSDSILDGVTRDSFIRIAEDAGFKVEERPVSVEEIKKAFTDKTITEAFGAGTAAVASPIKTIGIGGVNYHLPANRQGSVAEQLKSTLENIRTGKVADRYHWNDII